MDAMSVGRLRSHQLDSCMQSCKCINSQPFRDARDFSSKMPVDLQSSAFAPLKDARAGREPVVLAKAYVQDPGRDGLKDQAGLEGLNREPDALGISEVACLNKMLCAPAQHAARRCCNRLPRPAG